MSRILQRIVLDNTVLSSLQRANAVASVLSLRRGLFVVTYQVRDEARAWKAHGLYLGELLHRLQHDGTIELTTVEPGTEGRLFSQLHRTRGAGESASIAVAHSRGYAVATDDYQAKGSCAGLNPPVPVLATEDVLSMFARDGALPAHEARRIWAAIGISDSKRGLSI